VLDAALAGRLEISTSSSLLDELRRVLTYPKLQSSIGDADQLGVAHPGRSDPART
jgi:predicted nucleic acid-binding protein